MNKKIKAIVFDIDGTLLNNRLKSVSDKTLKALESLKTNGYKIYVCTSRCLGELHNFNHYIEKIGFNGIITSAGGMIKHHSGKLSYNYLNKDEAISLLDYCKDHNYTVRYQTKSQCFINDILTKEAYDALIYFYEYCPDIQAYDGKEDMVSLFIFDDGKHDYSLKNKYPHSDFVYFSDSFEVNLKGINKAKALEYLLSLDNISLDECMAFGDGYNDIKMLEAVGIGVAMGNGKEELKKIADYVTETIDNEGIEAALKHFELI